MECNNNKITVKILRAKCLHTVQWGCDNEAQGLRLVTRLYMLEDAIGHNFMNVREFLITEIREERKGAAARGCARKKRQDGDSRITFASAAST